MHDLKQLEARIREIAIKLQPDYPNINNANPMEQLYAIESGYEGIEKACHDWAKFGKYLWDGIGMTNDQVSSLWYRVVYGRNK
jgi:hypothetical protein